jgi:hypothetical protein
MSPPAPITEVDLAGKFDATYQSVTKCGATIEPYSSASSLQIG